MVMETLANLESFVRSAEASGFSAAARRLSLTPAAVSRNVAMLERNLGVRLFQRSTRKLTLTEAGEWFLSAIQANLEGLQLSIASIAKHRGTPSGILKVSTSTTFGVEQILPLLPDFLKRYPHIQLDWSFEHRPVDLIAEGFDAAIGGGFELPQGLVSRVLAPGHLIFVASPTYLRGRKLPSEPSDLASFDGIVMRSSQTRRIYKRPMRNAAGEEREVSLRSTIVFDDPQAMRQAALLGLGVTQIIVADALHYLEGGALVRLLPKRFVDAGAISIYYSSRAMMPTKTRVFVDFIAESFWRNRLAERFSAQATQSTSRARVNSTRV